MSVPLKPDEIAHLKQKIKALRNVIDGKSGLNSDECGSCGHLYDLHGATEWDNWCNVCDVNGHYIGGYRKAE
jgi:hypothetical protein